MQVVYPETGFFSLADPGQWIKQQQKRGGEKISFIIFIYLFSSK
jgi:hypothetical protein